MKNLQWHSIASGYSSFANKTAKYVDKNLELVGSKQNTFFGLVFIIFPLLMILATVSEYFEYGVFYFEKELVSEVLELLFFTSPFYLIGLFFVFNAPKQVFDKEKGKMEDKRKFFAGKDIELDKVAAIQVFSYMYHKSSSKGGSTQVHCYQLNLVFEDGERFNLMNSSNKKGVMKVAEALKNYLDVEMFTRFEV